MAMSNDSKLKINRAVRNQFILGRQGLWPGRRWRGKKGVEQAIEQLGSLQIDPTTIVAPSQDLVLWGRVRDYQPSFLSELVYKDRKFFDYGGNLRVLPMHEMPYWRLVMQRKGREKRWIRFAKENKKLIATVKAEVVARGPLRNRDFESRRTANYRSSKEAGVALYYLWLSGELMIVRREGKARVYDLLENLVPAAHARIAPQKEMEDFFAIKSIAVHGILNTRSFRNTWKGFIERFVDPDEGSRKLQQMLRAGIIAEVGIENEKETFFVLPEDLPKLALLAGGKFLKAWKPLDSTSAQEVVFLSPLDQITSRAKLLFDFDTIWEIYKPAHKRKYGSYTMPILYGERLVGRADFKLDKESCTLLINGAWLESWFEIDKHFIQAYSKGLKGFAKFLKAETIDTSKVQIPQLRRAA